MRLAVTPRWHAGQACSGGAAGLGPPDAPGAGAISSSQHSGHSTCGRPCRPCPCSHTKYAAPATSSKFRPPPKGSPGALGMRRCIAVHLSLDKAARPGTIAGTGPFQCDTIRPIDAKACRRCPRPPMWPVPHSGRIRRSLTTVQVSVSHATLSALVTHRARDPPDLNGYEIDADHGLAHAYLDVRRCQAYGSGGCRRLSRPVVRVPIPLPGARLVRWPLLPWSGAGSWREGERSIRLGALRSPGRWRWKCQLVRNSSSAFGWTARCRCSVAFPFRTW